MYVLLVLAENFFFFFYQKNFLPDFSIILRPCTHPLYVTPCLDGLCLGRLLLASSYIYALPRFFGLVITLPPSITWYFCDMACKWYGCFCNGEKKKQGVVFCNRPICGKWIIKTILKRPAMELYLQALDGILICNINLIPVFSGSEYPIL